MTRPSVLDYARHAARHSLCPDGETFRQERIDHLRHRGVEDEQSFVDHIVDVLEADDTLCACLSEGREFYANDRLNTVVILNTRQPDRSTAFNNDIEILHASDRLYTAAGEDKADFGVIVSIRVGGYDALQQDRPIQERHKFKP